MYEGIPSPFVVRAHPYPSRFHGTSSVRPVFGFPFVRKPHNVLMPNQYKGLGAEIATVPTTTAPDEIDYPEKHIGWDTSDGIFRDYEVGGGGLFNNVSGLGMTVDAKSVSLFMVGAGIAFAAVSLVLANRKKA